MFKHLLLTFMVLGLVACSGIKKKCEKTNWYDYGFKIAKSGKRLTGDKFIAQCQEAEAKIKHADMDAGWKAGRSNYCKPKMVYNLGKSGEFFNPDLCGENLRTLKKQHEKGVHAFCQKDSAYKHGASGKVYNKICPAALEANFLPEYYRGRKVYLQEQIDIHNDKVKQLDEQAQAKRDAVRRKQTELLSLPDSKIRRTVRKYDPLTKTYVEEMVEEENESVKSQRRDIQWDIDRLEREINSFQNEKRKTQEHIRNLRTELRSIP